MTDYRDWTGKVGSVWAQEWRRTDRSFRELTPVLIEATRSLGLASVLDIGCGAGEISCTLARDFPQSRVTGVDISPELLAVARDRGRPFANCEFVHADAAGFVLAGEAPDSLVSRHGVMFFADPVGAFAHLRGVARAGAGLAFSCFAERRDNGWVEATLSALPAPPAAPDPREPGPFAFGDRDRVRSILDRAGWGDIRIEAVAFSMIFGEGEDAVGDARDYLTRVGPAATPIAALEDGERAATLDRLTRVLERSRDAQTVALPAAAWIVTARAPD